MLETNDSQQAGGRTLWAGALETPCSCAGGTGAGNELVVEGHARKAGTQQRGKSGKYCEQLEALLASLRTSNQSTRLINLPHSKWSL